MEPVNCGRGRSLQLGRGVGILALITGAALAPGVIPATTPAVAAGPLAAPVGGSADSVATAGHRVANLAIRASTGRAYRVATGAASKGQVVLASVSARLGRPHQRRQVQLRISEVPGSTSASTVTRSVTGSRWTTLTLRHTVSTEAMLRADVRNQGRMIRLQLRAPTLVVMPTPERGGDAQPGNGGEGQPGQPGGGTPPVTETPSPGSEPTGAPDSRGWRLAWSDEFNGSSLDQASWSAYHNTYGDGNHELACLTPGNVGVAGGELTVVSRRETVTCPGGSVRSYTSGFVSSRETGRLFPLYGRYEMRAQLPHGQGLWPAFWLRHVLGAGVAEVDIMEYFHSQVPGKATQTLHFPSSVGRNKVKLSTFFERPVTGTGGWHTFAVDIEPVGGGSQVQFTFYIDGAKTAEYLNTSPAAWNQVDPQHAWDIALNTAVGGDWAGHPDQQLGYLPNVGMCSLTWRAPANGDPANCPTSKDGVSIQLATLPAEYRIDYVRVYVR